MEAVTEKLALANTEISTLKAEKKALEAQVESLEAQVESLKTQVRECEAQDSVPQVIRRPSSVIPQEQLQQLESEEETLPGKEEETTSLKSLQHRSLEKAGQIDVTLASKNSKTSKTSKQGSKQGSKQDKVLLEKAALQTELQRKNASESAPTDPLGEASEGLVARRDVEEGIPRIRRRFSLEHLELDSEPRPPLRGEKPREVDREKVEGLNQFEAELKSIGMAFDQHKSAELRTVKATEQGKTELDALQQMLQLAEISMREREYKGLEMDLMRSELDVVGYNIQKLQADMTRDDSHKEKQIARINYFAKRMKDLMIKLGDGDREASRKNRAMTSC